MILSVTEVQGRKCLAIGGRQVSFRGKPVEIAPEVEALLHCLKPGCRLVEVDNLGYNMPLEMCTTIRSVGLGGTETDICIIIFTRPETEPYFGFFSISGPQVSKFEVVGQFLRITRTDGWGYLILDYHPQP